MYEEQEVWPGAGTECRADAGGGDCVGGLGWVKSTSVVRCRSGRASLDTKDRVSGLGLGAGRRRRTVLRASARGWVSAPPEVSDSESRVVRFSGEASRRVRYFPFLMILVGSEAGYIWWDKLLNIMLGCRMSLRTCFERTREDLRSWAMKAVPWSDRMCLGRPTRCE